MAEPVTIYVPRKDPVSAEELRQYADNARVDVAGEGEQWTEATVEFSDATLSLNFQPDQDEEEFAQHLSGFQGYVWKCAQQKMTAPVYALIERLYLVHSNIGMIAEPKVTPQVESFISSLAGNVHGIIMRGSAVCSPDFTPLISPEGYHEGAAMSYWPDSVERQDRSIDRLQAMGYEVPIFLPIASAHEVRLRTLEQVATRAQILYFTAYSAVPNGIDRAVALKQLAPRVDKLSDNERAYFESVEPGQQEAVNMAWRFEALWVLMWALQLVDDLGPLDAPQVVAEMDDILEKAGGISNLGVDAKLRPVGEILDQADFILRAHWVQRQAARPDSGIETDWTPGVIMERHHALNWLIGFQRSSWDDVETPT